VSFLLPLSSPNLIHLRPSAPTPLARSFQAMPRRSAKQGALSLLQVQALPHQSWSRRRLLPPGDAQGPRLLLSLASPELCASSFPSRRPSSAPPSSPGAVCASSFPWRHPRPAPPPSSSTGAPPELERIEAIWPRGGVNRPAHKN
jgi:hypothetical protein